MRVTFWYDGKVEEIWNITAIKYEDNGNVMHLCAGEGHDMKEDVYSIPTDMVITTCAK